jgi:cytochrome c peroxidase
MQICPEERVSFTEFVMQRSARPSFFCYRWHCLLATALLGTVFLVGVPVGASENVSIDSASQAALGQQLFNDKQLSQDGTISCASCHNPARSFTDGLPVATGVGHRIGTRNTPSLAGLAASGETSFFWDGRRASLKEAVLDPLTNPVEMGFDNQAQLTTKLRASTDANGKNLGVETLDQAAAALAAYILSIKQTESNYDRFRSGQDPKALSPRAQEGLALFAGRARCAQCHSLQGSPATLTDHKFHRTGVGIGDVEQKLPQLTTEVIQQSLSGAELGNQIATHADEAQLGRFNVSHDIADVETFRTPSLRTVASTAPYMHDGSVKTLDEALDREIYYRSLSTGRPLNLSVEERKDLLAFLQAL